MADVVYEIVQHDRGWAYKVNGVFSEPFPTHAAALAAAQVAGAEQEIPGHGETIEYEDDKGKWHTEAASGQDRPHTASRTRIELFGPERTMRRVLRGYAKDKKWQSNSYWCDANSF
jgi:hypothetical protein